MERDHDADGDRWVTEGISTAGLRVVFPYRVPRALWEERNPPELPPPPLPTTACMVVGDEDEARLEEP